VEDETMMQRGWCCRAAVLAAAIVMGLAAAGPAAMAQERAEAVAACPRCSAALDAGWCATCATGYVRGLEIKCRSCLGAMRSAAGGWCEACEVGYVGGSKTKCASCFAAMQVPDGAWCDGCKVGYVGARKTSCRSCFAAMRAPGGAWCDGCKVGYVGARKTSCRSCFAAMRAPDGGWCEGCSVGYARGLETRCRTCFAAIAANGTCDGCGMRFQDGRSLRRVALHVHGLGAEGATDAVRGILAKQAGVGAIAIEPEKGIARFELDTTDGATVEPIAAALEAAGYAAHEGGH
jgi:hypothetical protein